MEGHEKFQSHSQMSTIWLHRSEKNAKIKISPENSNENVALLPNCFSVFMKTLPTEMTPTKCPTPEKKNMAAGKAKEVGRRGSKR